MITEQNECKSFLIYNKKWNICVGIWYVFNSFLGNVLESKFNRAVAVVIVESEDWTEWHYKCNLFKSSSFLWLCNVISITSQHSLSAHSHFKWLDSESCYGIVNDLFMCFVSYVFVFHSFSYILHPFTDNDRNAVHSMCIFICVKKNTNRDGSMEMVFVLVFFYSTIE